MSNSSPQQHVKVDQKRSYSELLCDITKNWGTTDFNNSCWNDVFPRM